MQVFRIKAVIFEPDGSCESFDLWQYGLFSFVLFSSEEVAEAHLFSKIDDVFVEAGNMGVREFGILSNPCVSITVESVDVIDQMP